MKPDSPRMMQLVFACLLIWVQAIALASYFQTYLFSAAVAIAALSAMVSKKRLIPTQIASRLPLILPILFVIQRSFMPESFYQGKQSFLMPGACLIAEYFVVFQVALMFADSKEKDGSKRNHLPSFLPVLAMTALVFSGDICVAGAGRWGFQILSLLLVLFSIGFYFASRRQFGDVASRIVGRQVWWLVAVGTLCCIVGWASATGLHSYARQIEAALNGMVHSSVRPNSAGFSGKGRIGSVAKQKGTAGDRVALRVMASQTPGYLRGKVFDNYVRSQWEHHSTASSVVPPTGEPHHAFGNPNDAFFRLGTHQQETAELIDDAKALEIWPAQSFREVVFSPLAVTAMQAPIEQLSVDDFGVISADTMPSNTRYIVWPCESDKSATAKPTELSSSQLSQMTTLPESIDPRIVAMAKTLFVDATTTSDKVAAVENFFLEHYEYQFGIDIPSGRDPIEYFLLERPPAHCEYFASGAVLLLRSVGVPCRYVTGFVAAEKNKYGDYWVARNRDAHAWAEAYDPSFGWVIVEATPPSGTPQTSSPSATTSSQLWDAAKSQWQRTLAFIRAGGIKGLIAAIVPLLIHPIMIVILIVAALTFGYRRIQTRRQTNSLEVVDPRLRQMHGLLRRMDERWSQQGFTREPFETLHQFAVRLESSEATPFQTEAARWYRQFASLRFSGQLDAESIESLRQETLESAHCSTNVSRGP